MKKILVTGGTVFVSKYIAQYYVKKGYQVYVLNRNTKKQPEGTIDRSVTITDDIGSELTIPVSNVEMLLMLMRELELDAAQLLSLDKDEGGEVQ